MKTPALLLQATLALAALIAAYFTWQRPSDAAPGAVTVIDATRAQVEHVRYEDEHGWVELRPEAGTDDSAWLRLSAVEAPASPDEAATVPAAAQHGKKPVPERELRGGQAARDLLARFGPLTASRALGVLPEEKLGELGLTDSKKRLTVGTRGATRTFVVATSVLGGNNPYLLDERTREVYLLGPGLIPDLEAASTRLVDRRLHTFRVGDFDALVVQRADGKREFTAVGKPPQEIDFVPKSGEGAGVPDVVTRSWHGRLWRVTVNEVFGKDEKPQGLNAASPELRVSYLEKSRELGFLEVVRGAQGELFARSERTAGWVQLHVTSADLIEETKKIVAAQ